MYYGKTLEEKIEALYNLFEEIKNEVKDKDSDVYEKWKAGGFIVETDVMSMYPNLSEVEEELGECGAEEEEEDEED